ncbi:hypothetical protein ACJJI5_10565 [Microbulbifer sp. EKSA008]|uniref:hypothetical protein n=1 Tax=unclassified Microbulbifer TaxID=2619833 RepID=UPI00404112C9
MSEKDLIANLPVPDEYLIELGKITVMYGALEFSIDRAISKLAGYESMLDWRVSVMTAHLTFQQRVNALGTLFEQVSESYPNLSGYAKVIERIKGVQKQRNKFVHSMYTNGDKSEVGIWSLSARGSLTIKSQDVYIQEVRNVSVEIDKVRVQLEKLITASESYEKSA